MPIKIRHWIVSLLVVGAFIGTLAIGGCTPSQSNSSTNNTNTTASITNITPPPPPNLPTTSPTTSLPKLEGTATVIMTVKGEPITIEVNGSDAPITAGNFVDLVNRGVYNGLAFHRVVRQPEPFVVQGGDPQSKDTKFPSEKLGTGGFIDPANNQPRLIPLEIKSKTGKTPIYSKTFKDAGISESPKLTHTRGAVAMARSAFPDSASSQFYITLAELKFLDGNYAVFGYVKEGMNVVDKIQQGDRIESATVTQGLENLKVNTQ